MKNVTLCYGKDGQLLKGGIFEGVIENNSDASASPQKLSMFCVLSQIMKGIFSDSNNIILWHESEDINKKR